METNNWICERNKMGLVQFMWNSNALNFLFTANFWIWGVVQSRHFLYRLIWLLYETALIYFHPLSRISICPTLLQAIPEEDDHLQATSHAHRASADLGSGSEVDVAQWNVLQFNTGSTTPFIIKCGANSNSELVIKADARVQEPKGGEIVRVVPRPSVLENMSLEEIKQVFSQLPEALSLLSLARTADGTRARYSRLYRTLAMKVPSLRDLVGELEKGGVLKDVRSWLKIFVVKWFYALCSIVLCEVCLYQFGGFVQFGVVIYSVACQF